MKRLAVFLILITLALPGFAQVQYPDMDFFINFSALSNSPPAPGLQGQASYYRAEQLHPLYPPLEYSTNSLELFVSLSSPPASAWLVEQQADGSFTPVAAVTNLFGDPADGFYLEQSFTLTTNQVQSLVNGNWYAEVDFADGNYIGNLAPSLGAAHGPTAVVGVSQAYPEIEINPYSSQMVTNAFNYTAIARNNRTAEVIFDGSPSTDPFYLPLQYSWAGWVNDAPVGPPLFTSSKILATNVFALGFFLIQLQAEDTIAVGSPTYVSLQVVTARQVLNPLVSGIPDAAMPKSEQKILTDILSRAETLFDHGFDAEGCLELECYQNIVQHSRFNRLETFYLLHLVQEVLAACQGGAGKS